MSKYLETAKIAFKSRIAYRFDVALSMIFTASKILLAYVLWGAVFADRTMVAGFTLDAMLTYYVISSFITQLDQSEHLCYRIGLEIKNGLFSKYMVRPMGTLSYFASQAAGSAAFLAAFNLVAALVWIIVFRIGFVFAPSPANMAAAAVLVVLGLLFLLQLRYFIGILAFKFVDTIIFRMVTDNIVQFVTGSLIPLALMPGPVVDAMFYLPFYHVSYLPSMLLMGRNGGEALAGMLILAAWNIVFMAVNAATYAKLRTGYEGVGV